MSFKSILNPDASVLLGLANGGVVMAIYNGAIPPLAAVRVSDPQDTDIESSRKMAAWTSAAVLGFMFLITRDRNSFLIGGLVLAGTDFMVKHANGMNPLSGMLDDKKDDQVRSLDDQANIYPMPGYDEGADDMEMG